MSVRCIVDQWWWWWWWWRCCCLMFLTGMWVPVLDCHCELSVYSPVLSPNRCLVMLFWQWLSWSSLSELLVILSSAIVTAGPWRYCLTSFRIAFSESKRLNVSVVLFFVKCTKLKPIYRRLSSTTCMPLHFRWLTDFIIWSSCIWPYMGKSAYWL